MAEYPVRQVRLDPGAPDDWTFRNCHEYWDWGPEPPRVDSAAHQLHQEQICLEQRTKDRAREASARAARQEQARQEVAKYEVAAHRVSRRRKPAAGQVYRAIVPFKTR